MYVDNIGPCPEKRADRIARRENSTARTGSPSISRHSPARKEAGRARARAEAAPVSICASVYTGSPTICRISAGEQKRGRTLSARLSQAGWTCAAERTSRARAF
jgi:hypothetical protein